MLTIVDPPVEMDMDTHDYTLPYRGVDNRDLPRRAAHTGCHGYCMQNHLVLCMVALDELLPPLRGSYRRQELLNEQTVAAFIEKYRP